MSLEQTYRKHHSEKSREGFAILEKERGLLFKRLVGAGKKVLDLGCRDGIITKYLVDGNEVTGADIDSVALRHINQLLGIKTLHFDVQQENWPVPELYFDVVVAGELLEHVYFPADLLRKIKKVLKPSGIVVGSVPNAFALKNRIKYLFAVKRGTPLEDPMHINQFSWEELRRILEENFKEVKLYPLGKKRFGLADEFPALLAHSIAFLVNKD